jgi:hypothetical protein
MQRGLILGSLVALAMLATPVVAQADFEAAAGATPTCANIYPTGCGTTGGPENVSWNGIGFGFPRTDATANGCGFPCNGSQYLRVVGNGPIVPTPGFGVCPQLGGIGSQGPIPSVATLVWIPIPNGGNVPQLSFCWDWYNAEGGLSSTFNDGCRIDIVDASCNVLQNLICVDTQDTSGPCSDSMGGCFSFGPEVGAATGFTNGVENFNMVGPLIAGAAFLQIGAWNAGDNAVSGHCVIDNVAFAPPCLLSITGTQVGPDYTIAIKNTNCNPGAFTYTSLTVLPCTIGWFFGIDPSIGEILSQVTSGVPPFIQFLDGAGNSCFSITLLNTTGPLGISISGVTVYLDAFFVPTPATNALCGVII